MADITHILKGKFDRQDINEIMVQLRATTLSSADRIHVSLQGRRARINNRQFRNLSKQIALSGIALTEGALGTNLSEFLISGVDVAATEPTGITYDTSDDTLWICDITGQKIYNVGLAGGAPNSSITFASFDAGAGNVQGVSIDPSGDLWVVSSTTNKVYKMDDTGTLDYDFDTNLTTPLDVAYDGITNTLWVPDANTQRVYNFSLTGTVLDSFAFPEENGSPGNIEGLTANNNKLWVVDTGFKKVMKLDTNGTLIQEYPVSAFEAGATNTLGIAIGPDGTAWITDGATQKVYNVMGTDLTSWLGEGLIIHSDNGFNKRINN